VAYDTRQRGRLDSAIRGADGEVDAGYLGLLMVGLTSLGVLPVSLTLMLLRMFLEPGHPLDLVGLAAVVGSSGGCFAAAAAGVGAFRAGDKNAGVSNSGSIVVRERSDNGVQSDGVEVRSAASSGS